MNRYTIEIKGDRVIVTDTVFGDNHYGKITNGKLSCSNGLDLAIISKAMKNAK